MKYNTFIDASPKVSELGLGAWQLGVNSGWKDMSETEAINMVHMALDSGINFIDTAPNYGHGTGESRLGKALQTVDRDSFVLNTKFGHTDDGRLNFESSYIRTSLEGSLRRLKLEYVDSLIIHNPPSDYLDGNKNDHYEILEKLKDEGKIRAYGASLDSYEDMRLFMETTGCEVIEAFLNILHQDSVRAFDLAIAKKVGIIAKIPYDSGWLTGKYNASSQFTGVRSRWSEDDIKTRAALVKRVSEIIGNDLSIMEAALLFCLSFEAVSTVIPGNVSLQQLRQNIDVLNKSIPENVVLELKNFYKEEVEPLRIPW